MKWRKNKKADDIDENIETLEMDDEVIDSTDVSSDDDYVESDDESDIEEVEDELEESDDEDESDDEEESDDEDESDDEEESDDADDDFETEILTDDDFEDIEEEPKKSARQKRKEARKAKKAARKAKKEAKKEAKEKKSKKGLWITLGVMLGVLVCVYLGFALYFNSHFMFFTKINGNDYSMKNVEQVEAHMKQQVDNYVLTLEEADGGTETIDGDDISIQYVSGDKVEKLVKAQNNLLWIESLWNNPDITSEIGVSYDEEALKKQIEGLACMQADNQVAPVDAHPEFQDTQFVVVPEVTGTQINTDVFNQAVTDSINGFQDTLNLEESECYVKPKFVSDSEEVIAASEKMNSYLGAQVTYDFNPNTEIVDASVISQWLTVDGDMKVTFNNDKVKEYIKGLADKYDTRYKARSFTTANGNTVTVEGGSYGWQIDQDAEYKALIANIEKAETVSREPEYASRAASHEGNDVGSTYAEVDLSNQTMYFVQNGQVVLQSGVVTGNPNRGNGTPQGVYSLAYKALDQTLRGTRKADGTYEYETPVKYWMPFNGGIGFHDATWQSSFGGSRYLTNGSHGCVNLPYNVAAQLYNLISAGTPVVCHY